MSSVGRSVRVTGDVQGVFFRQWTVEQARELGVGGWVRNNRDGSVEAQAWGEREAVEALIERMRRGPPAARVANVVVEEVEPQSGAYFEVRRG